jgi:hypothetical protein
MTTTHMTMYRTRAAQPAAAAPPADHGGGAP